MRRFIGILALVLILSVPMNASAMEFKDLSSSHWSYDSIKWGLDKGLVVGYDDGMYKPKEQITEAEFVTVLSRYVKNVTAGEVTFGHWSQHFYDALKPFELPLRGNDNDIAKNTALTRGQIAQIIAAKNGFNLDERQAIYYMYENDISNGMIDGALTFDSYGREQAVNREQIPAFFQKLDKAGVTTFKGKTSIVKPYEVGGIKDIPKDNTVVTDKDFTDLAPEVPVISGAITNTDFTRAQEITEKNGLKFDGSGSGGFGLRTADNKKVILSYIKSTEDRFGINIKNYTRDKAIVLEIIKATEKFTDADLKRIAEIIEVDDPNDIGRGTNFHRINDKQMLKSSGFLNGEHFSGLTLTFAW